MGKRCFYEQDPTLDPEWGNAAEVFPFYFARVVKFGKGTALRMQGGGSLMRVRIPPWTLCAYSRME